MEIRTCLVEYRARDLILGYSGDHVDFDWRAYDDRSLVERESYDQLKENLIERGMLFPLITYGNHVLIGMRRTEIMICLHGPNIILRCRSIVEDVQKWTRDDIKRLELYKEKLYSRSNL